MELLTSFLVIVILATTSAKPTGWSRHHDADIADNDLSTLLELHAMRSSESWQSSQSSESWQSSQSSESETSESNSFSRKDSSDSSESSEEEEDDSDSSEESSEEVIIVIPVQTTTPGLESPSTATTPTVDAMSTTTPTVDMSTTTLPTTAPEGMSTGGPATAPPLTTHAVTVTLPGTEFTPCVTHDIVTPTQDILTPAPVTESRGDN